MVINLSNKAAEDPVTIGIIHMRKEAALLFAAQGTVRAYHN